MQVSTIGQYGWKAGFAHAAASSAAVLTAPSSAGEMATL
jgi:hypothetical protein